jgi:hypothetical protein
MTKLKRPKEPISNYQPDWDLYYEELKLYSAKLNEETIHLLQKANKKQSLAILILIIGNIILVVLNLFDL